MSLQHDFECVRAFAFLRAETPEIDALTRTSTDEDVMMMMMGVCRVQTYVARLCEQAVRSMPDGTLRTIVDMLVQEQCSVDVEILENEKQTCAVTKFTTDCVGLRVNSTGFVVSRLVLTPLFRCYAFAHVLDKLTQHEHARTDPFAYAVWREDERQLRMFMS